MSWKFAQSEAVLAAKMFTIRNLGCEHMLSPDLHDAYRRVDEMHIMDCGMSICEEYLSWLNGIEKGDCIYENEEWSKVRKKYL